ncbi:LtfC-like domain-containing protein [Rhodococcus qingshengii]|uniref:LtfC-like domain-containing protein n=1 Tax=Rhodococcus qingshengii TaxID=334542 RepID=UPI0010A68B51|nr:hypothetical protein [Rhodococcus qingshengii]THJ70001.1 hypothetical protein EU244_20290 [Rhodococcus qingshengii]
MAGLGWTPYYEDINLRDGQDWITRIPRDAREGPIPAGTTTEVEWANGTTWAGEIEDDAVVFRVESEQADFIPQGTEHTIWVRYPNGDTETFDDYPFYVGKARRNAFTVRN